MRTLKLTIAYDGTRYAGWQVQRSNTHDARRTTQKPTVQGTLERVLQSILREPVKVVGSGRTDAGVHALSQIAHVKTRSTLTRERLLRSVNALLPPDIAVTAVDEADEAFHARFTACRKRYRYRVFTGAVVPPFIRPYVHHVRTPLNLAAMRREAALLKGAHDFKAFARAGGAPRATTRRRITQVELRRRGEEIQLDLEGNGFLHTMVRSIAGTLLDVGRGRLPPGTVRRMLKRGERQLAGTTAPAQGLSLVSVNYQNHP
ncbi:MAG: tRNA pseudouridine(38-40) synthase TruA [Candidatus Omnitrophica bacterium]|nr:tRNA pseudouridine(38-40) synthase TruA [Candidatus Omnitrophota bacterium]